MVAISLDPFPGGGLSRRTSNRTRIRFHAVATAPSNVRAYKPHRSVSWRGGDITPVSQPSSWSSWPAVAAELLYVPTGRVAGGASAWYLGGTQDPRREPNRRAASSRHSCPGRFWDVVASPAAAFVAVLWRGRTTMTGRLCCMQHSLGDAAQRPAQEAGAAMARHDNEVAATKWAHPFSIPPRPWQRVGCPVCASASIRTDHVIVRWGCSERRRSVRRIK